MPAWRQSSYPSPACPDPVRRHLLSAQRIAAHRGQALRAELFRLSPLVAGDFSVIILKGGGLPPARPEDSRAACLGHRPARALLPPARHGRSPAPGRLASRRAGCLDERYYRDWSHQTPHALSRQPAGSQHPPRHHPGHRQPGLRSLRPSLARSEMVPGTPFRVLSLEDQVLHACLHCFHDGDWTCGSGKWWTSTASCGKVQPARFWEALIHRIRAGPSPPPLVRTPLRPPVDGLPRARQRHGASARPLPADPLVHGHADSPRPAAAGPGSSSTLASRPPRHCYGPATTCSGCPRTYFFLTWPTRPDGASRHTWTGANFHPSMSLERPGLEPVQIAQKRGWTRRAQPLHPEGSRVVQATMPASVSICSVRRTLVSLAHDAGTADEFAPERELGNGQPVMLTRLPWRRCPGKARHRRRCAPAGNY